jgi:DeoR/GlpR family transcriptional regulator of sugar metabolism
MFAHERHQAIIDLLARRHKATLPELQRVLGTSPATLRRDVAALEADGKIIRMRGAVAHPAYFRGEPTLAQKNRAASAAKRAIAQSAAALVPPRATVLLDSGSTCLALGKLLITRADLTLITNSLPLAMLSCDGQGGARVLCIGGEVRSMSGALVGAAALTWLGNIRADWCFLSASGLSKSEGASTTELSEAATKQEFLKRAENTCLLADATKWEKPVTMKFAAWSEFQIWISDADDAALRAIRRQGVRVIKAR